MAVLDGLRNEMEEKSREPFTEKSTDYWAAEDCVGELFKRAPLLTASLMKRFADVSNERMEESLQKSAYGREGGKLIFSIRKSRMRNPAGGI